MHALSLTAPFGSIRVHWHQETLTGIDLNPAESALQDSAEPDPDAASVMPVLIVSQLHAYFSDGSARFELPLALSGTAFQQRVWAVLRTIPSGETRTYGEVARVLGSAARAVGQACRANPCPIVVPCHRVVAVQGLGGFSGDTSGSRLAIKRWLLHHEGVRIPDHH
ncbi:methylated-DNA--[protein]-cysteine S-methyltransferase [Thiobaca trueperi]|uniref:methylated-DNA--[protein]-cysteine S-methyltransferase n=1 Tax=Thiobaca trueperi TaxID=127458 RepID=A0A4V2V1I5_9GAMM|nr:methylated-DNA--[protein]-cysteine S-methyltransferase [Thiobaca trueperi]TCT21332.1 methylated-DNA-[protein]-cysteine S-methyltransferase [Thiobaca trueperi]